MIEVILAGNILLSQAVQLTVNHPDFKYNLGDRWEHKVSYVRRPFLNRVISWRYHGSNEIFINSKHSRSLCQQVGSICMMRGLITETVKYKSKESYKLADSCTKICEGHNGR